MINLQDQRWVGYVLLLVGLLITWFGSFYLYTINEWFIFALFPITILFMISASITGNYFDIEVDTSTDNSSCYYCGVSKSFLGRRVRWAHRFGHHCESFHCLSCHETNKCKGLQ